jgi:hypothetical protein
MNPPSLRTAGVLAVTALATILSLGIPNAAARTAAGANAEADKEATIKNENPFEIQLSNNGMNLKAVLINRSGSARSVLCDGLLQPSRLEIVSSRGESVKSFDSREVMKYDNTFHCRLLKSIPPGQSTEIGSARFQKSGKGFRAGWGPFEFGDLPAGDYRARVVWVSELGQCFDEDTNEMRTAAVVWMGRVESNEVTLRLR